MTPLKLSLSILIATLTACSRPANLSAYDREAASRANIIELCKTITMPCYKEEMEKEKVRVKATCPGFIARYQSPADICFPILSNCIAVFESFRLNEPK